MWRSEDNLVGVHSFTVWVLGIELSQEYRSFSTRSSHQPFIYLFSFGEGERGRKKEKEDEDDDKDYSSQTWLLEIIGAEEVCW